jgi:IclR family transcriptional regulator, acetate operon repressor
VKTRPRYATDMVVSVWWTRVTDRAMPNRSRGGMARRRSTTTAIKSVRAVERALDVLQCFSADRPSMSVLEIRSSGDPQRFSLDYGVGRLADNWMAGIDPIRAGQRIVERLRERTNETAALFILRGHQRLCALEIAASHVLKISRGVGETEHISKGASGKAILAFMQPDEIDVILRTMPKDTNRKQLLQALDRIRRDGFAISRAEVFAGAVAIAAPYFDRDKRVSGSIGVFGPQARLDDNWERSAIRLVVQGAAELSAALGQPRDGARRSAAAAPRRRG